MARPEKHDCDYFPFYAKDGRTLHILENKYGCLGTGFFTNVLRFLTLQPDHHFCIDDESDLLYFFSRCKCDEESGIDMLNIMSKTRKIHTSLWVSYKVIVSEDLLSSLEDAYRNRKNKIITINEILEKYVSDVGNTQENEVSYVENSPDKEDHDISYVDNPQTKLKETKVNNKVILPDNISEKIWKEFKKHRAKNKKPMTEHAEELMIKKLNVFTKIGYNPEELINETIVKGWQDINPEWIYKDRPEKIIKSSTQELCKKCNKPGAISSDGICIKCLLED